MKKTEMNPGVLDYNWSYEWEPIISKVFKDIWKKFRCIKMFVCVPQLCPLREPRSSNTPIAVGPPSAYILLSK